MTIRPLAPSRNFRGREGYDPKFLGVDVPLPTLDPSIRDRAAPLLAHPDEVELRYNHFSVIMDKERRQPLVTAENLNGSTHREIERDQRHLRLHQLRAPVRAVESPRLAGPGELHPR